MNILYICHRIPYPPNKGDKIRSFNEVKYLSKKHNVFLAFLIDDKKDLIYLDELKKYCETIDYDVIHPRWQKIKSIPYLFSKKPLSVPYFYSKKLQTAIDYRLLTVKFDVVFAFSSPMAEYVFRSKVIQFASSSPGRLKKTGINMPSGSRVNGQAKFIMDFVDVDSDKWRMYSEYSLFPKSLIYRNEWKRLMSYEKRVGAAFDISVFISDNELEIFKSYTPKVKAVSISNGVDFEYFGDVRNVRDVRTNEVIERAGRSDGLNILFTGAMDYFPNEDGMIFFYRNIWPTVKEKLPQSKFYIVGGNPSKKLKSLPEKDNDIVVTGYVNDVREYMRKADVFVAPLRIARGMQNKVLEAMAAGLPVVATPQAAQGIDSNNDSFLFVEDSADKFAERTIKLSEMYPSNDDIEKRESFFRKRYDWDENMSLLDKLILGGHRR